MKPFLLASAWIAPLWVATAGFIVLWADSLTALTALANRLL